MVLFYLNWTSFVLGRKREMGFIWLCRSRDVQRITERVSVYPYSLFFPCHKSLVHNGFDFIWTFFSLFLPFPAIVILKQLGETAITVILLAGFFSFGSDIKLKISEGRFFGLFPSAAPHRLR